MQILKKLSFLFLLFLLYSRPNLYSQNNLFRSFDIDIFENNVLLENPWVGGLYNPQFYQIDIDFDNDNDLVIFDYQGSSIMCFENLIETTGINDYNFNPDYSNQFPKLSNWINLRDFNCDNIPDLFSYNPDQGSVVQYIGYQNSDNLISFLVHDSLLRTNYNNESTLLSFSEFDRPAFEDIDNDGDLDLLFFNNSDQVDFHSNQSVELYGHCDSLIFEFITDCWGQFDEDQDNFSFNLGITCDSIEFSSLLPHTGSTRMLFFDYENDNDLDLIGGFGNSKNLAFLTNGGTTEEALMTDVDSLFPEEGILIDLPNFPAAYFLDMNNDNKKELVISSSFNGKAENNIWLYNNLDNENEWPVWEFDKDNFLQDEMIDHGAYSNPTIVDYDLDELPDLIISNRGIATGPNANIYSAYLSLYKNTGSLDSPEFELIEKDWMGFSNLNYSHIKATFGDLDNDGDSDLIFGDYFGKIFYLENIAILGQSMNFDLNNIIELDLDVGYFATPHLVDIDNDGDFDILSGEAQGRVFYYKNNGNSEDFSFELENDFYGAIDVRPQNSVLGYSVPFLFSPNLDSSRILFVGTIEGKVLSFKGVDESFTNFESIDSDLQFVETGANASPTVLSNDMDEGFLIIGGIRGGLQLYEFDEDLFLNAISLNQSNSNESVQLKVYPNPFQNGYLNLEFPYLPNSQKGMVYIINSLGQITFSNSLNLNQNKVKYDLNISEHEIHNGVNVILWVSEDGMDRLYSLLVK